MTDAKSLEETVRLIALSYYSLDGSTKMSVAGCRVLSRKAIVLRKAGGRLPPSGSRADNVPQPQNRLQNLAAEPGPDISSPLPHSRMDRAVLLQQQG